jgi:hypothetical protein
MLADRSSSSSDQAQQSPIDPARGAVRPSDILFLTHSLLQMLQRCIAKGFRPQQTAVRIVDPTSAAQERTQRTGGIKPSSARTVPFEWSAPGGERIVKDAARMALNAAERLLLERQTTDEPCELSEDDEPSDDSQPDDAGRLHDSQQRQEADEGEDAGAEE